MESMAAIGGSGGGIEIGGEIYGIRPLTIQELGEFERFVRDEQQRAFLAFYDKFQQAGKPIGYEERSRSMARIVAQPFTFSDLVSALDTMVGAAWVLKRALTKDGKPVAADFVDNLPGGVVLSVITQVAMKAGILDPSDLAKEPTENPTSPRPES